MIWKVELCFESNEGDAESIDDSIRDFLLSSLVSMPDDVPWAMITTYELESEGERAWKPLLHSSRR